MDQVIKSTILRFVRGAVAGAIATMIPMLPQDISSITNVKQWLVSLSVAGFIGAITGLILAVDKYLRANGSTTATPTVPTNTSAQ